MSTAKEIHGNNRFPVELSPLDIVELEAALDPFCPQVDGGEYRPERCLPWCRVCESLLIRRKEAA